MANDQMRQNWAVGASGWVQNERIFDAVYAPVTQAILRASSIDPADRVLDIGCGTGTLLGGRRDRCPGDRDRHLARDGRGSTAAGA